MTLRAGKGKKKQVIELKKGRMEAKKEKKRKERREESLETDILECSKFK